MDDIETEYAKAVVEYFKHLATLSTGSIILIATLLEKVFPVPLWKNAVTVSLIGFLVSVISSAVVYTGHIWFVFPRHASDRGGDLTGWQENGFLAGTFFTWIGFIVGIVSFGLFAIVNLSK